MIPIFKNALNSFGLGDTFSDSTNSDQQNQQQSQSNSYQTYSHEDRLNFVLYKNFALLGLMGGCETKWQFVDSDGDGHAGPGEDCYEREQGPIEDGWDNSAILELDYGVQTEVDGGEDIYYGAYDAPYDGIDADCGGDSDFDADDDGYLREGYPEGENLTLGTGTVEQYMPVGDCDDQDASVYPGAIEICDGIDNDCDGVSDNPGFVQDGPEVEVLEVYVDADGDGYGDPNYPYWVCEDQIPSGYVTNSDDCNDSKPDWNPDAIWYADSDSDGYGDSDDIIVQCLPPTGYIDIDGDCDDTRADINPGEVEICDPDNIDEDCNGLADDDDSSVDTSSQYTWWRDADVDGYGTSTDEVIACDEPAGYSLNLNGDDCDDADPDVNPIGTELCDSKDNDCNGLIDDNPVTSAVVYYDGDGDGYGNPSASLELEECNIPSDYVSNANDCDDTSAAINPAATEVCNGLDDDCDSLIDDDDTSLDTSTTSAWYDDADGDGYGDATAVTNSCAQPSGAVSDFTDCDDTDAAINPNTQWFADNDSDTYGDASSVTTQCSQPTGTVLDDQDCDDTNSSINPGATEICDASNTDEDCDGVSDDQDSSVDTSGYTTYYVDNDADGYGSTITVEACDLPSGAATANGDCDDSNANVSPSATEVCNGIDDDCDADVDDDDSSLDTSTASTWYADNDGDGYGDSSSSVLACDPGSAYTDNTDDCDDSNADVWSTKVESFNGYDDNCDGVTDYDVSYTTASGIWIGEDASAQAGFEIAGGGDLDNDGFDDFAVGAPGEDGTGVAYIVNAGSGTSSLASEIKISGTYSGAETGESLAYGDANDDGFVDLIVGSPDDASNYGVVYLMEGPITNSTSVASAAATMIGSGNGAYAGEQVRSGCDVTGDNIDDILIGEPAANKSYVVNGPVSSSFTLGSTTAYAVYTGANANDYTGYVRCLGDVNADGYDDFGVGGWGVDYGGTLSGSSYWMYGPVSSGLQSVTVSDVRIDGESAGDNFGSSGGFGVGDVNDDGYADVIVDAIGDDDAASAAGAVYLFYGNSTRSGSMSAGTYDAKFLGESTNNNAGTRAGIVGDLDNDGYDDIAISAYNWNSVRGAAYAVYGSTSLLGSISLSTAEGKVIGDNNLDTFGRGVGQVGDLNGDSYDDLVIGASNYDASSNDVGAAFWFSGF